jgi:hypothetical protein
MRKLILGAVLALVLPAAAMAEEGTPSPEKLAATACKTERAEMGAKQFKLANGGVKSMARAKKNCLGTNEAIAQTELKNAAQECKAAREADPVAFAEWGENANGKNAFGKCVSATAKAKTQETTENRVSAADTCKAAKKADATKFSTDFGGKKNAFGKCVSQTAKALAEAEETEQTQA